MIYPDQISKFPACLSVSVCLTTSLPLSISSSLPSLPSSVPLVLSCCSFPSPTACFILSPQLPHPSCLSLSPLLYPHPTFLSLSLSLSYLSGCLISCKSVFSSTFQSQLNVSNLAYKVYDIRKRNNNCLLVSSCS